MQFSFCASVFLKPTLDLSCLRIFVAKLLHLFAVWFLCVSLILPSANKARVVFGTLASCLVYFDPFFEMNLNRLNYTDVLAP